MGANRSIRIVVGLLSITSILCYILFSKPPESSFAFDVIGSMKDEDTSLYVVLGEVKSFSSRIVEVYVLPSLPTEFRRSNEPLATLNHIVSPISLRKIGGCYSVIGEFEDYEINKSIHVDEKTGRSICINVVSTLRSRRRAQLRLQYIGMHP